MSVTVEELLELPSLRQAKVLGGRKGLGRIVSSISVLESTDPQVLVEDVFPQGEFYGSEIVITGFLNILDDVDRQCANMRRLAEGGEVGLILFYVGVYLPRVDQRLVDLADEMDFVLIAMPEGQKNLRYSEVISDVMGCIVRDRTHPGSIVLDILARVSNLPEHQQTVSTVVKMLSDHLSATVALCDGSFHVLSLASWPRGLEEDAKTCIEGRRDFPRSGESAPCDLLPECRLTRLSVECGAARHFELLLMTDGADPSPETAGQAVEVIRLGVNIWGQHHSDVAMHELFRAILQDEPLKMRRLANIFHVDVASISEMWIIAGDGPRDEELLRGGGAEVRDLAKAVAETVIADVYDRQLVLFMSAPRSERAARERADLILDLLRGGGAGGRDAGGAGAGCGTGVTLSRFSGLQNTAEVRRAYLCHRGSVGDARRIFPHRSCFCQGETGFAAECRRSIDRGELSVDEALAVLRPLQAPNDEWSYLDTLSVYLLDCDGSVTRAAELLFLHKNTVKYRLSRIADLLGCQPDRMPVTASLYRALAVRRMLEPL